MKTTLYPATRADDHAQGPASASVVLVEFGDYECPYCAQAHIIINALIAELGDKMRFIFRNYPLVDAHPDAMAAALIAESASNDQFWRLHHTIYTNSDALDEASLLRYADASGVPETTALAALRGSTRVKVEADVASGDLSGVEGTPTFYINGRRFDADWSRPSLSQALRRAIDGR